jgi:D-serine deaminase-like pyridoxal phosphate-dependent protein
MPDPHAELRRFVAEQRELTLDWRSKGFGPLTPPLAAAQLADAGVRLSDLGTPMLTVDRAAVQHNLDAMGRWCADRGLALAPHGKTTMAPALWLAQLDAGVRGITVANAAQLRAAYAFGVRSLVVANELVTTADLRWLAERLAADPALEVLSWVDSVAAVERIESALAGQPVVRPLTVCVEVGSLDGRTGSRAPADVLALADRVVASPACRLAGLSGYEGAAGGAGTDPAGLVAVERFLQTMVAAYEALAERFETPVVTVTAGGSAHFDQVAELLGPLAGERHGHRVEVLLRSGAYVVHDDVHYGAITPSTRGNGPELRPAIHVWSAVLSRPEPGLVLLDAGKRDLPFDLGLPVVLAGVRRGDPVTPLEVGPAEVLRLNDQHAFVRVAASYPLEVGDVFRLGLAHPCTAFDKWRTVAVVDSAGSPDPHVVDALTTYF